jgi:hypothetical protein
MRVRVALALALLATLIGFVIDMSGSAPRLAGDNHVRWPAPDAAVAVAPPGTLTCVTVVLPGDTGSVVLGIHGPSRLPRITARVLSTTGRLITRGSLPAGAAPGAAISIPLRVPHGADAVGKLCLRGGGHAALVYDGQMGVGLTTVNGVTAPGSPALLFYRPGRESWWALLGALDRRVGFGKSTIFGDWTLPALALCALALFAAVVRLLLRELP